MTFTNIFTVFLLCLTFASQVNAVQVDNSPNVNLQADGPTTINGPLVCGGRNASDCEADSSCTSLTGVYLTGPNTFESTFLTCGQKGVCPVDVNVTGLRCVKRSNVPKGDTFQVTGQQFLCNSYAGVVESPCPDESMEDDRQMLAGKITNDPGCVLSSLDTFVFPPFTDSNNQRVQKVVYMFEVRTSPNYTEASSPSFSVTNLLFYVNLNDKTTVKNSIGFVEGTFNFTQTEEITGSPQLFNSLPNNGVRYFGITTHQPAGEIEADIEPQFNCSVARSESAPKPYQSIQLMLTLNADTDFFNQTLFAETMAYVLNVSSSSVTFTSQKWVKRVVQESQVTLTFTGPDAADHVSHFIYLYASEDPILAENGIEVTSVSYSATSNTSDDDDSGLSKAAIAGIVIACVVGAIVIIGVIILIAKSSPGRKPDDAKTQMLY